MEVILFNGFQESLVAVVEFKSRAIIAAAFLAFIFISLWRKHKESKFMEFFKGKSIVITGGSSGLGERLAEKLISVSNKVYLMSRDLSGWEERLKEDPATKDKVELVPADVSNIDSIKGAFARVAEKEKIDGVFVNAGTIAMGEFRRIRADKVAQVFDVNLKGSALTTKFALENMNEGGFVAFTSSVAGLGYPPDASLYSTSKSALRIFARILGFELIPRGVSVTCFMPGFFKSKFLTGNNNTPFTYSLDEVVDKYLQAVSNRKREVVFPLPLIVAQYFWILLYKMGLADIIAANAEKNYRNLHDLGDMSLDPKKETKLADFFGLKRFTLMLMPPFLGPAYKYILNKFKKGDGK